jgi:hypothetical protein
MPRRTRRAPQLQAAALAIGIGMAALCPAARALDFVFTDIGSTPMNAEQLKAVSTAADYWSSKLSDKVTVYISIGFTDLSGSQLGSTSANLLTIDYADLRSRLAADARSATDASVLAHLQPGPALSFKATQGDLSTRLDNDGSLNNTQLGIQNANAKALGIAVNSNPNNPDAAISFANAFAGQFAYSRSNGDIPGNKIDFITLAEHEIGHALGFVSGVDGIDSCTTDPVTCGLPATANRFENRWWYYPLDLFRYSAPGQMDVTLGGQPYFSIDGGATAIQPFSTGVQHGNGWQASHFGTNALTLMKPFVENGLSYDATTADLTALDAIGWDLTTAVPEPQAWLMALGGLAVLGWRRRQA